MKKVFGLMFVLALAGLVSCGETVVETPVETSTVEIQTPSVEVEAVETPSVEVEAVETPMDDTMEGTPSEEDPMDTVVDETITPTPTAE